MQRHHEKHNAYTYQLNTQQIQINKGEIRTVSSLRDVYQSLDGYRESTLMNQSPALLKRPPLLQNAFLSSV